MINLSPKQVAIIIGIILVVLALGIFKFGWLGYWAPSPDQLTANVKNLCRQQQCNGTVTIRGRIFDCGKSRWGQCTPTEVSPGITPTPLPTKPEPPSPAPTPPVVSALYRKWHPGHYMLALLNSTQSEFDKIFSSPSWRGVQVGYFWRDLEPQKGVYNFSKIESDLAYLQQHGKYLIAQIAIRRFNDPTPPVPDYLLTDPEYGGGVEYSVMRDGSIARLWDPDVLNRIKALDSALATRFDTHPNFEGVNFEHTSIDIDFNNAPEYSHEAYLQALKDRHANLKQVWRHSNVAQYANRSPQGAPADWLSSLANYDLAIGMGWGGPSVIPGETKEGYNLYPLFHGQTELIGAVQGSQLGGPAGTFTAAQLFTMGVDTLKLTHMAWILGNANQPYTPTGSEIISYVNGQQGRINSGCPVKTGECATGP